MFLLLFLLPFSLQAEIKNPLQRIDTWGKSFFSEADKNLIKRYMADDYLENKKKEEIRIRSAKLFHFLKLGIGEEIRAEIKENPFLDLPWPDSLEWLEYHMQKIESQSYDR